MKKRAKKWILPAAVLLVGLLSLGLCYTIMERKRPWYERYQTVTHALGVTEEGETATNSLEAFLYNYKRGQRVFEADVQVASDGVMVLRHDWGQDLGQGDAFGWTEEDKPVPTSKQFTEAPIMGTYTPLTLEQWFALMAKYRDVYFITDTKYTPDVNTQFRLFVDTAVEAGYEEVLDRVIVQIYYREMYDEVTAVYPFQNFIWTLYYTGWPGGEVVTTFLEEKQIPVIVMPYTDWYAGGDAYNTLVDREDIRVYVHTVDEEDLARQLLETVDGVYSDTITDKMIDTWDAHSF